MAIEMKSVFQCLECKDVLDTDKIGVYQKCQCGNIGIDALSKNYIRVIGYNNPYEHRHEPTDELLKYAEDRDMIYFITREGNCAFAIDNEYYIDIRDGFSFFLYHYKEGFIGKFSKIKHAYSRKRYSRKESINGSGSKKSI